MSDVLTFEFTKGRIYAQSDSCGTVYLETTWASKRKLRIESGQPVLHYILRLPFAIAARAAHRALSGPYTAREEIFSWRACGRIRKKLEQLCIQNQYDWVVAVSGPYCMHDIACHADLHGAQLALYYFDPYSSHTLFSSRNRLNRMRQECKNLEKANKVFASLEHQEDWQTTALSKYMYKVFFIPYPNLTHNKGKIGPTSFSIIPDRINLIYLGALHDRVRYPEIMFSLFQEMLALDPRLQLYVIGYRSGTHVEQQIRDARKRLGEHLVCMDAIPFPQAIALLNQADCAVNLGNYMRNQMPSKLLDYIASGKPILNISHNRPCNTKPYIERYPWAMQFYEDDLADAQLMHNAAEIAVQFVREHQGKVLPWETVEHNMAGFTSKDVAEQFLAALTEQG